MGTEIILKITLGAGLIAAAVAASPKPFKHREKFLLAFVPLACQLLLWKEEKFVSS